QLHIKLGHDGTMPGINIGDTIALKDKAGDPLGELAIREVRYGAWCGAFTAGTGYDRVRHLFLRWTKLVSDQVLGSPLTRIEEEISAIGISAFRGSEPLPVGDVQIYDERDQIEGSFRFVA